jgi:hypothetical protein
MKKLFLGFFKLNIFTAQNISKIRDVVKYVMK